MSDSEGVRFKAASARGGDWRQATLACLAELGEAPAEANLGFLYGTSPLAGDLDHILALLRDTTRVETWVGTVGGGVASSGVEYHEEPAVSIMVAALPEDGFRVFQPVVDSLAPFQAEHGEWIERHGPFFGIVHGDPRNAKIDQVLSELSAATSTFLVGGLSAAPEAMPQIAGRVVEGGLSGVLFDPGLAVVSGLSQGCSLIGQQRLVTECERNVIKTLDGRPALEVLKEDIGEILARDLRRIGGYIHVAFPIPGTDTGDYLVRNLIGLDLERQLVGVGELVTEGQAIQFCRRDNASAEQDLKRMLSDVKARADRPPKAAVYFSCLARGPHLFGPQSEELRLLRDELGDLPLVGFYANGEISNNRLYGYTGVLALFL